MFVHADVGKGTGLIGVIGQLYEMSFNHVLPFPSETCEFRIALKELECRVDNGSALILPPISGADHTDIIPTALLVTRRACLGTLDTLLFETTVINNGHRVALAAFIRAVYTRWKRVLHFRFPRRLRHLGLTGKVHLEAVARVDVLDPLLSGYARGG